MSIFQLVGEMFRRVIAYMVFLFLGSVAIIALLALLALIYFVLEGHL